MKISIEPSWRAVAEIAIQLMEHSETDQGKEDAKKSIRDMGDKLAQVRASQPDCPEHLILEEEQRRNN